MKQTLQHWYIPGIISLLFLFPLLFNSLYRQGAFKQQTMINLVCQEKPDNFSNDDDADVLVFKKPNRNNQYFELNADVVHDAKMLIQIDQSVRRMITSADTINGIAIQFLPTATYYSLISALNVVLKNKLRSYTLNEGCLWIWYEIPIEMAKISSPIVLCGYGEAIRAKARKHLREEKTKGLQREQTTIFNDLGLTWLLFLFLVLGSVMRLSKLYNQQNLKPVTGER